MSPRKPKFHDFTILTRHGATKDSLVAMDGVPLRGVTRVNVDADTRVTKVTIEFIANSLDYEELDDSE